MLDDSDVEQIRGFARRLRALAVKARQINLEDYARQLDDLATEADAYADKLADERP
jgi:hypothetical protein